MAAALGLDTADRERLLASRRARPNGQANLAVHGLHVGILGPLSVRRGEQQVELRAPLQRALLGLLALQAGQAIPSGELVETLWGEDPPPTHQTLLHGQVTRLRRLLEPDRPAGAPARVLLRDGGGYRLGLTPSGNLDLARFDELVVAAERARASGDPGLACELLARALGCWRGPLLADADPSGWLRWHPAAVAAGQRRLAAAVALGDLANDLGRHQQAAALLEPLAREEPLHEGLAARLMLALAGSGEQAAALRLFTEMRERLADEFGIDPYDESCAPRTCRYSVAGSRGGRPPLVRRDPGQVRVTRRRARNPCHP